MTGIGWTYFAESPLSGMGWTTRMIGGRGGVWDADGAFWPNIRPVRAITANPE